MWTPGYWSYAPAGYYWVPGVWAFAPYVGALWTPGYWGYNAGRYGFHQGYWGRRIQQMAAAVTGLVVFHAGLRGPRHAADNNSPGTKAALIPVKETNAYPFETAEIKGTIQPQRVPRGDAAGG